MSESQDLSAQENVTATDALRRDSGGDEPSSLAAPEPETQAATDLDREIAEAMASMSEADAGALSGDVTTSECVEPGSELTGTVVGISDDELFLEFSAKAQGVLARSEFGKKEPIEVGRRVDVVVDRFDEESSLLIVRRKGATQRATWNNLSRGMLVEGRATGVVKGGLELDVQGIRAFMPLSQVDTFPMKDISILLGEKIRCEVVEVDRRHKNLVVSRRKIIERDRAAAREQLEQELEVGQVRRGVVKNITDFGAFVDLGGLEGLVHISDLSWASVEKVSDVVSSGQDVEVKVLKIDTKRGRISLGLKHTQPDPWQGAGERYSAGADLKVRVTRLVDFGAFAELEPGIEGLIPISEMSWTRIHQSSDAVSVGDMVDVQILRVEMSKRRIALSMKQALPDPWEGVLESFTERSLVTGRVTRLADFGAFVELTPGVEGLIHISELSDRHVRTCGDVVEVGQAVETRVLGVDAENRRISLSIKQVSAPQPSAEEAQAAAEPPQPPKKRKKPLRGGLNSHFDW